MPGLFRIQYSALQKLLFCKPQRFYSPKHLKGMNKTKAIILGILASSAFAFAGSEWTLEQCLKQAKSKSLQLESAKLREQSADVSVKLAQSGKKPTVSANINNSLFDHPLADHPQNHYNLSVGLSGSYVLWDGGTTAKNTEASILSKEATAFNTKTTERTIQESVLNAYMSLLAAQENLKTANSSVELSQAEFDHYSKLYEAGSITKKDLTQSQSNILQKQASLLSAQLNVSTSKTTLRQLLELPANEEINVIAPETSIASPDSLEPLPAFDQVMSDARQAHPGLKADSISIKAAKKNTEVAGTNNSVTVTLGASIGTNMTAWQTDNYGGQLKDNYTHTISLGINIPIIDGGTTTNKVLQAQVNEAESQVSLQETAKTLENNIEKLYLNAISADMQWKAAILQVSAEEEALVVAEEQRNAGALTYTDFLSQKNSLESAQVQLVNAKYTSLLARKLLELYQGKLD